MQNPVCKQCRRAGDKLFLKGERCFSTKCAMVKRPYAPGTSGKGFRGKVSEYGKQLLEKQKLKRAYGMRETQFRNYFEESLSKKGVTSENLIQKLESRLDNVVFRLGWAISRAQARQLVNHGKVLVNSRRVDIPSFIVKKGDVITFKESFKKSKYIENLKLALKKYDAPAWLVSDKEKLEAKVIDFAGIEQSDVNVDLSLIVEFYSR